MGFFAAIFPVLAHRAGILFCSFPKANRQSRQAGDFPFANPPIPR